VATITKTTIGTSQPIDICHGFALFPFGTVRAGITEGSQAATWLNVQPQILAWRLGVSAGWSLLAGMCGPAYAILFDAEGHTEGQTVQLAITNDEVQAGFAFGFTFGGQAALTLQQDRPHWIWDGWHSHFADDWQTVLNFQPRFSFDLINLLLTVILQLLKEQGKADTLLQQVNRFTPSLIGTWGLFDAKRSQFASNNGTWSVNPTFQLPINLVPLMIALPPPGDALALVDKALQPFLGYLRAGPTLGVSVPVTIRMTHISVDDQTYGDLHASGGTVTGTGGAASATAQKVGVTLDHQPGFNLSAGFFFALGVLKLFSFSVSSSTLELSSVLGIKIEFGTYTNSLASPVGGHPEPVHAHGSVAEAAQLEIIFEPAEIGT
jgi:hypothetical protein